MADIREEAADQVLMSKEEYDHWEGVRILLGFPRTCTLGKAVGI